MALTKISTGMLKQDAASSDLNIDAGTLYLDVSNNRVGIANTSPSQALNITGNALATGWFRGAGGSATTPTFLVDGSTGMFRASSNDIGFSTAGSERMRIDSSGNLLVGQTSAYTGAGVTISGDGVVQAERNNISGVFNRTSTDGDIVQFRKDGSVVGSIGTDGGDMYLGTGITGVIFNNANNAILPYRTNAEDDANIDIGLSNFRFKDLYLSGGTWITGSVPRLYLNDSDGTSTIGEIRQLSDAIIIKSRNGTSNGVIRFSGDNGTTETEHARFDASGNLLVGTTNTLPGVGNTIAGISLYNDGRIFASKSANTTMSLNRNTSNGNILELRKDGSTVGSIGVVSDDRMYFATADGLGLQFDKDNNRIIPSDAAGGYNNNVELGDSTLEFTNLWLSGTVNVGSNTTISPDGSNGQIKQASGVLYYKSGEHNFQNAAGTTEYARFDTSGNLLVAKTSLNDNLAGFQTSPSGETRITRSGGLTLVLNRKTSDGEILGFRKDGTTVGSIGTSGGLLVIGDSDCGIAFEDGTTNHIYPWNVSGGAANNDAISLGANGAAFKDLYLSGTIAAGTGTSASTATISAYSRTVSSGLVSALRIIESTGASTYWDIGANNGSTPSLNFYVNANTSPKMTLAHSGNVGIGTTSPQEKLQINGNLRMFSAGYPLIDIGITTSNYFRFLHDNPNDIFKIGKNGAATLNIAGSGNVGIGTDSPTQKLEVAGTALVENAKLKAIAESNTDTAVDVFVYDTRKDSDGGAWRKRTQHTSWYNETLNTSTRGSRREFPCVAVIVIESLKLTVYDGDDPDLPMWMVINADASTGGGVSHSSSGITTTKALFHVSTLNATAGLNGQMIVGTGNWQVFNFNFVDDKISFHAQYGSFSAGQAIYSTPIGGRNSSGRFVRATSVGILTNSVNDVAMTVLPNAPIDADTGLPVPTIAVATNGGVSVIKDDGTVVDITHTNYTISYQVKFLPSGGIAYTTDNSSNQRWLHVDHTLPSSDNTKGIGYSGASDDEMYHTVDGSTYTGQDMKFSLDKLNAGFIVTNQGNITVGSLEYGIGLIARNPSLPSEGLIAEITSDYNTGYMHGDIKLATLSDTDTTNAASTDLLGGIGNFTDANDWTVPSGWSLSSNVATGSAVTAYLLPASNGILTAGKKYAVTVTQSSYTSGAVYMYMGTGAPSGVYYSNLPSTVGTFTYILTAYNSNFGIYGANYTGVIDNVTISLAEEDRSYNDNGLQVFGTVTKSAVATGAELVGYYGWGTNNYLEQPYTTDLDFGAGDFCMMWWQKKDALTGSTAAVPIEFSNRDVDIDGTPSALVYEYLNRVRFYTRGTSGGWHFIEEPTDLVAGAWQCYAVVRRGGKKEIWRNGKLAIRDTAIDTRFVTSTSTILRVGKRSDGSGSPFDGMISLVRVTATVPSEKQIAKMYNDEKHLFATNAKATLYGSSDAVTALAYDDDTELLHIGTSAGRSVFQGLNRVDNTTDAVGAAISASNGFIVEE